MASTHRERESLATFNKVNELAATNDGFTRILNIMVATFVIVRAFKRQRHSLIYLSTEQLALQPSQISLES
jgi:hypothetical protein